MTGNVNKNDGRLSAHDTSTGDAFGMHQSPSSLSLVNDFSINKPHPDAPSVVVGDQLDAAALMSVVPIGLSSRPDANLGIEALFLGHVDHNDR